MKDDDTDISNRSGTNREPTGLYKLCNHQIQLFFSGLLMGSGCVIVTIAFEDQVWTHTHGHKEPITK